MGIFSSQKAPERPLPQLTNLDGSPIATRSFDNGFRQLAQVLTAPGFQLGVAANFAIAAAECLNSGGAIGDAVMNGCSRMDGQIMIGILSYYVGRLVMTTLPRGGADAAINKAGHVGPAQDLAQDAARKLAITSKGLVFGASVDVLFSLGSGPFAAFSDNIAVALVCQAAWNVYAARKLEKGAWTIDSHPPEPPARRKKGRMFGMGM